MTNGAHSTLASASPRPSSSSTQRIRTLPWFLVPLAIFALTRVVDAALILFTVRNHIHVVGGSSAGGPPPLSRGTSYFQAIADWDGQWYRAIVEHGYPLHLPVVGGVVQQNAWAYYPLYPMLVRLFTTSGLSFGLAASLVSVGCGAAAMCLLYRMLSSTAGRVSASLTVLALCTFPAAITFQTAYAESLALLLILASLWSLREQRYGRLVVLAVLLSLTRPIALPLALVVGLHWLARWRHRSIEPFPARDRVVVALAAGSIAATFAIWPVVAGVVTGRPDAYFATSTTGSPPARAPPGRPGSACCTASEALR
jgi:Gpi18-like mannosyltransferase